MEMKNMMAFADAKRFIDDDKNSMQDDLMSTSLSNSLTGKQSKYGGSDMNTDSGAYQSAVHYLSKWKKAGNSEKIVSNGADLVDFKKNIDLLLSVYFLLDQNNEAGLDGKISADDLQNHTHYKNKPFVDRLSWLIDNELLDIHANDDILIKLTAKAKQYLKSLV
jgi:hypothetical protein